MISGLLRGKHCILNSPVFDLLIRLSDQWPYDISENCLAFNVIRPAGSHGKGLSVVVWIHGSVTLPYHFNEILKLLLEEASSRAAHQISDTTLVILLKTRSVSANQSLQSPLRTVCLGGVSSTATPSALLV
jgi:hypothetical protein